MGTMGIDGTCDDRFGAVRRAFEENFAAGKDVGASVAVAVEGEMVVDLWGGTVTTDADAERPWERDTIINVWSTTKTMTALCCLVLIDRGELDPHEPIASYWPGFETAGKASVTTAHVLSHSAGLSGWDQPMTVDDLYDWDLATELLAKQAPWWEPGTASGYHAVTQGYLLGEVVRRISGRSLGAFFADEIAGPLGADFQIGAAAADEGRIAPVVPPPPLPFDLSQMDPLSPAVRTLTGPPIEAGMANTSAWRAADIGGANGHGNARSVARMLSAVTLGGKLDNIRLLSSEAISLIFEQQSDGVDLVVGVPLRFGIGFGLPHTETVPYIPEGRICFWGGWGGSSIVMDIDRRMTFSYMMNRMGAGIVGSSRSEAYIRGIYGSLGIALPEARTATQA
jgi:CubicO group peptidase (beta-lactamase class C family)